MRAGRQEQDHQNGCTASNIEVVLIVAFSLEYGNYNICSAVVAVFVAKDIDVSVFS
jgi:hypothetical protein